MQCVATVLSQRGLGVPQYHWPLSIASTGLKWYSALHRSLASIQIPYVDIMWVSCFRQVWTMQRKRFVHTLIYGWSEVTQRYSITRCLVLYFSFFSLFLCMSVLLVYLYFCFVINFCCFDICIQVYINSINLAINLP